MPQIPLHVRILAIGKIKGSLFAPACADYLGRLRHYFGIEVIEVRTRLGEGRPETQALLDEGRELLKHAREGAKLVALQSAGPQYASADFARLLQKQIDEGARKLDFIIGGASGLSAEVLARCTQRLSLSNMTFAHELARVILLEQLYRAGTIMRGEKYHK